MQNSDKNSVSQNLASVNNKDPPQSAEKHVPLKVSDDDLSQNLGNESLHSLAHLPNIASPDLSTKLRVPEGSTSTMSLFRDAIPLDKNTTPFVNTTVGNNACNVYPTPFREGSYSSISANNRREEMPSVTIINDDYIQNIRVYIDEEDIKSVPTEIIHEDYFSNPKSRRRFVIGVLILVALGIVIQSGFVVLMLTSLTFVHFLHSPQATPLYICAVIIMAAWMFMFFCFPSMLMHNKTCSIIAYVLFVFCASVFSLILARAVEATTVFTAFCLLFSSIVAAIVLIMFVNIDFKAYYGIVALGFVSLTICVSLAVLLSIIMTLNFFRSLLVAALMLLLYVAFLMDLQGVLGGRNSELQPDMYFFGALILYVDMVTIFQYLLMLLGYFEHHHRHRGVSTFQMVE